MEYVRIVSVFFIELFIVTIKHFDVFKGARISNHFGENHRRRLGGY